MLYCTAILVDCETMYYFQQAFRAILIILASTSTASHQDLVESIQYIKDRISSRGIQMDRNAYTEKSSAGNSEINVEENIKQSYFAVLGQHIYDEVRKVLHNTDARQEINSLQCIPIIQLLLRYGAYLPLWSGMLLGDLKRHENGSEVTLSSMHATKTVAGIWM